MGNCDIFKRILFSHSVLHDLSEMCVLFIFNWIDVLNKFKCGVNLWLPRNFSSLLNYRLTNSRWWPKIKFDRIKWSQCVTRKKLRTS